MLQHGVKCDLYLTFATGSEPFVAIQEGQETVVYKAAGEELMRQIKRFCPEAEMSVELLGAKE